MVDRREFAKLLTCAAANSSLTPPSWDSAVESAANAKTFFTLQPFDYDGVGLLDGMLTRQLDATRTTYYNIPNDSLLLGFRRRAGMPAPGEGTGWLVWQRHFQYFPQMLSGMARMAKATGDTAHHDKNFSAWQTDPRNLVSFLTAAPRFNLCLSIKWRRASRIRR
jgi:hypothetical protein